jgi:hypothetical protein
LLGKDGSAHDFFRAKFDELKADEDRLLRENISLGQTKSDAARRKALMAKIEEIQVKCPHIRTGGRYVRVKVKSSNTNNHSRIISLKYSRHEQIREGLMVCTNHATNSRPHKYEHLHFNKN